MSELNTAGRRVCPAGRVARRAGRTAVPEKAADARGALAARMSAKTTASAAGAGRGREPKGWRLVARMATPREVLASPSEVVKTQAREGAEILVEGDEAGSGAEGQGGEPDIGPAVGGETWGVAPGGHLGFRAARLMHENNLRQRSKSVVGAPSLVGG